MEPSNSEKSPIPGDEFAQDSLKIVSLPPVENDSVGEISLTKQLKSSSPFTSISSIDHSVSCSETNSMIFKETEAMNVEDGVVSVAGTVSAFLEDDRVDRELQQIKETSAPSDSLNGPSSEISKEGEQFGDDMHKMDEVDDTDGSLLPISEIQAVEQDYIAPNAKESLKSEAKEQESEAQRLLEAEKRRLLAEIEVGSIFRKSADVAPSEFHKIEKNGNGSKEQHKTVVERVRVMDIAAVKRSVKIELIDDTALVDVVPCYKKGNNHPKRPGSAHADKDAPRKHKKKTGEKPIDGKEDKGNASKAVEGNASARVYEFHNREGKNGKQCRIVYSRNQLESMRFAHIVNQRTLWSEMYARLVPEVLAEYEGLVCSKSQKTSKSNHVRWQPIQGENLDTEEGIEDQDYTEDNDDYNSILRPAFAVDGEPDFDSGPPEDGLEYLRRVRWEAKGIPNVRVAKIDESKYIKKEQSVYMPQIPEIPKCPEHLLPVKEWEDSLLSDFLHLRQALSQEANECEEDEMMMSVENVFIDMFNKCLHTERDESLGGMVTEIQGMDSVTRVSKLKKRIGLVEKESGLQSSDCRWVVALCASLDTPLDGDTCACLRGLLRKCASVRAEKSLEEVGDRDEEVIVMANMLITIAGRYFGQMGQ